MSKFGTSLAAGVLALAAGRAAWAQAPAVNFACQKGDNAPALQALLDAGGTVNITTNGRCLLGSGLRLTQSGTTLNGAGQTVTVLRPMQPNSFDIITVGVPAAKWHGAGFTVSNLTVNGAVLEPVPVVANPVGRDIVVKGGVYADEQYPFGLAITNVTTRNGVDGVAINGSDVTATHLTSQDNRHSGFFVMGLATIPPPHNIAQNIKLLGSKIRDDALDNAVGLTWDAVDISKYTANVTIGGPGAGDGNSVLNGDILMGCPPAEAKCMADPIGPFLVQHNKVDNTNIQVQGVGIRTYGNVSGAVIDGNTVQTTHNAIGAFGNTTHSKITNNILLHGHAAALVLYPLRGAADAVMTGDDILVDHNSIVMDDPNKPAIEVIAHTNVTVTNNDTHGSAYAVEQAGAGFSAASNK